MAINLDTIGVNKTISQHVAAPCIWRATGRTQFAFLLEHELQPERTQVTQVTHIKRGRTLDSV